jgi:AcrR family transcriptional regulator
MRAVGEGSPPTGGAGGTLARQFSTDGDVLPDKHAGAKPRTRDADRTKTRIFDAAVAEFAAKGFDGARIDKIAERSGVNKRMIYIYWGDKEDLYREILRRKVMAMHEIFTADWSTAGENLVRYFNGTGREIELLRFVQWEALGDLRPPLTAEQERREAFGLNTAALQQDQERGKLSADIPADYLMLLFMALACYPMAFPQNTRLVTGLSWDDPEFQAGWSDTLRLLADLLGPRANTPAARARGKATKAPVKTTAKAPGRTAKAAPAKAPAEAAKAPGRVTKATAARATPAKAPAEAVKAPGRTAKATPAKSAARASAKAPGAAKATVKAAKATKAT